MKTNEMLLAQLEREAAVTRRAIENVPEGKNDWKPHPKSFSMGSLAALVASMPSWITLIIDSEELDLAGGKGQGAVETKAELLQILDKGVEAARKSLANATEEHLAKPWRLRMGDKVLVEQPRNVVLPDTFCHLAHHRGQLTVYLRLNDEPVPAIYGASADSGW